MTPPTTTEGAPSASTPNVVSEILNRYSTVDITFSSLGTVVNVTTTGAAGVRATGTPSSSTSNDSDVDVDVDTTEATQELFRNPEAGTTVPFCTHTRQAANLQ